MAYLIANLVASMQYILTEYAVHNPAPVSMRIKLSFRNDAGLLWGW